MKALQKHQIVVNTIVKKIYNGELRAGMKLPPEKELSRELQVDRTTLRVGMKLIEAMNILDIRQGDGMYVADFIENAGIDFMTHLFARFDDELIDEYLLGEVWNFIMLVMPNILKQAIRGMSPWNVRELLALIDGEIEYYDDPDRCAVIVLDEVRLFFKTVNNVLLMLLFNSLKPMLVKVMAHFIQKLGKEGYREYTGHRKKLVKVLSTCPPGDVDGHIEEFKKLFQKTFEKSVVI